MPGASCSSGAATRAASGSRSSDGAPERRAEPEAAQALAQRRVRARLPPGPFEGESLPRALRVPARGGRARAGRRRTPRACRSPSASAAPSTGRRSSGVLREAFWAEAERLPEGADYVVVARPDSRELAEREGMPGVRTALAELDRRDGRVDRMTRAPAVVVAIAPDPRLPAVHLAGLPAPLQVPPDLLGVRRAGDRALRHTARRRPRDLAPAPLQSVQPRRP